MHDPKEFVIAAAIAAFGFVSPASAQKDAAEKAKEGGIEHWIEYYKAEQRKSPQTPVAAPVDHAAPADRTGPGTSPPGKPN